MSQLLGFSTDDIDFVLLNAATTTSIAAAGFDPTIIKTAISCTSRSQALESHRLYLIDQEWGGAARSDLRFQVRTVWQTTTQNDAGQKNPTILFKDVTGGRDLVRLATAGITTNSNIEHVLQYWNGTAWVTIGALQAVPAGDTTHTITIRLHATAGVIQWHMNGALIASLTGNTIFTASTTIDCISLWQALIRGGGFNTTVNFSEHLLGSYDYQTYGLRDQNLQIDGAGADATQDSGIFTDVNELVLNRATAMTFDTAGDHFSGTLSNPTGTAASSPVMGVRASANVRVGASGPTAAKLYLIVGGNRYYSPSISIAALGIGFVTIAYIWDVNPANGLAWTVADINALEVGIEAA